MLPAINVSPHQGYNGWNIGDVCYRKHTKCTIKVIDFHTNPPTLTVSLVSDPRREINTEFNLITKQPIQDPIEDQIIVPENEPMLPQKQNNTTNESVYAKDELNTKHNSLLTTITALIMSIILLIFIVSKIYNSASIFNANTDTNAIKDALSLIKNAKNMDRTADNDQLLRNARQIIDNKYDHIGAAVPIDETDRRYLIDWSYQYIGNVQIETGDIVAIRSNLGGLLYYNGTMNDIISIGEFRGDASLYLVSEVNNTEYGDNVFVFQNLANQQYLDAFGGDLSVFRYSDIYTQFILTPYGCTIDETSTTYRNAYAMLQTPIRTCPQIYPLQYTCQATSSREACGYCSSLFRFEIYN